LKITVSLRALITWALLLFACSFSAGLASEYITADGSWWQQNVPDEARPFVIAAMLNAYRSGWLDGTIDNGGRIFEELSGKLSQGNMQTVLNVVFRKDPSGSYISLTRVPKFSQTFGYYGEALSNFYAAHPSKGSTEVGDVLSCLSDALVANPDDTCKKMMAP
jgi:hypothetical protein